MENTIDAREILKHLNDQGYRNITKTQLKEFMMGKSGFKVILFRFHELNSSFL